MTEADPILRFVSLLEAARTREPFEGTSCVLATADGSGRPSARVVLLKSVGADGFTFFTNYRSRKAKDLETNPFAALCFHYPSLGQQVRVEGAIVKVSGDESDAYFATRPRGSQLGAWASPQSEEVESRAALEASLARVEATYAGADVPRPPHWGGFRLVPERVEFWQDREFRLHDRFLYTREGGSWAMRRLAP